MTTRQTRWRTSNRTYVDGSPCEVRRDPTRAIAELRHCGHVIGGPARSDRLWVGAIVKGSRPSAAKPGKAGLSTERGLWAEGHERIVGIDEVGKGAWAGPLTVGIAILPTQRRLYRVNDSKQLTERRREELFDRIAEWCEDWSVGHASPAECDELGMSDAQRLATRRALGGLQHPPDAYLVDGK